MSRMDESLPQETVDQGLNIEHLVREHYSYIHRLALSILDDPHEADDAAQETFIAASRNLAGFRGDASPRTWLTAITVNACRGRLRKRKARQASAEYTPGAAPGSTPHPHRRKRQPSSTMPITPFVWRWPGWMTNTACPSSCAMCTSSACLKLRLFSRPTPAPSIPACITPGAC